jgi:hypothetical protein
MQAGGERHGPGFAGALIGFAVCCLVLFATGANAADEMEFRVVEVGASENCGSKCLHIISAQGEITENSADKFSAFLDHNLRQRHLNGIVLLHSPGGNVVGATKLGKLLRQLGVAVVVARADGATKLIGADIRLAPGRCMSACVFVLMGGAKRVVPAPSTVGIHRMFRIETGRDPAGGPSYRRVFANAPFVEQLRQYSDEMGVSSSLVDSAERVSPDTVHIVSPAELRRWRLGSPKF